MANVGTAQMTITPKFDNLSASVNKALSGVDVSSSSAKLGSSVSDGVSRGLGGLAKSGALVGAFSTITSKAMDVIGSHVGSAVSRLDTLKNYPTVMSNLGVSSDEASTSIKTMSDRLSNLPTALNDMASTVQGLYTSARNYGLSLTDVTKAGLGLNDMLLAGGQSQGIVNAAMEQFRQMVSKGKPDMQDWKSLVMAAPAQLDQLAQAMLGPTANATALYYALGGGSEKDAKNAGYEWATISMDQLLQEITKLDTEGGEGITSFKEQAETAQGGVQTAMDNMSNAVTKGVEKIMDEVGRENIVGAINEVKGGINTAFGDLSDALSQNRGTLSSDVETILGIVKGGFSQVRNYLVSNSGEFVKIIDGVVGVAEKVAPVVSDIAGAIGPLVPAIVGVKVALKGLDVAKSAFSPIVTGAKTASGVAGKASDVLLDLATKADGKLANGLLNAAGAAGTLSTALSGPLGIGIGIAVAGIGLLVGKAMEAKQKEEDWANALQSIDDNTSRMTGLASYSETVQALGDNASFSALSIDDLRTSIEKHQQAIDSNLDSAEQQIATLSTAEDIIDNYTGKTDLSRDAQGRLQWALDQVNQALDLSITKEDVLNGKYTDQDGNVQDLTTSLDALIAKKKEEARISALSSSLTEAYEERSEAASTATEKQDEYNAALENAVGQYKAKYQSEGMSADAAEAAARADAEATLANSDVKKSLDDANQAYSESVTQCKTLEDQLGDTAEAAENTSNAYAALGDGMDMVTARLSKNGHSLGDLRETFEDMGADADALAGLSEDDMLRIATAYDGTATSISGALSSLGVKYDQAAVDAERFADSIADKMGISATAFQDALDYVGISTQDFAKAMQDAGLSADDMSSISQNDFATMVAGCGGSVDELISMIEEYNGYDIEDKDADVDVNTEQLFDAQGQVYTWNGSELVDQDGNAVVDDVSLTDAQGNLWTWNGSSLDQQDGTAEVDDVSLVDAQGRLYTWNGSSLVDQDGNTYISGNLETALGWIAAWNNTVLKPLHGVIDIVQNIFSGGGGGNARGGIVKARGHATGAVFTKPTWISSTDYIGEDGPEYYDGTNIVPLTSKHGQPFANLIADEVVRKWGGPNGGATYNTYIDGTRINDDAAIQGAFMAFMGELVRISDMG